MHKEIFESRTFTEYADSNLVLVNADFPRLAKHQLPAAQQKKNDKLADKYNEKGIFPITLLLDTDGKVLMTWEGLPNLSAEQFTNQVKAAADAHN
jgi:thioredoxin-related protein